jgi:hypothetical protein
MITEEELNFAIEEFATKIRNQQLGLVYYKPDSDSLPTMCIENVKHYVKKNGGTEKYGWTFHHRYSSEFGDYLFATHHSVWYAPNGNLIDITPFHSDPKHHPMTIEGSVLFLLDDSALPIKRGKYLIPRPLKYHAIEKSKELLEYMETLRAKEAKHYKESYGIVLKFKK